MIGHLGRYFAVNLAADPVVVRAMMAAALTLYEASTAEIAIADGLEKSS